VKGSGAHSGARKKGERLMGNFGMQELLIILLIVVLLFGAKRIPEIMRGMGRGVKEFKDGMRTEDDKPRQDEKKPDDENPGKPSAR
jgi:sec-independent protein translocase protein TatA